MARLLHAFVLELVAARWIVNSRFEFTFPWAAARLLNPDGEKVKTALVTLKFWFDKLKQLDKEARDNADAAEFRDSLLWPLWDWPRSLLICLSEHDFTKVQLHNNMEACLSTTESRTSFSLRPHLRNQVAS